MTRESLITLTKLLDYAERTGKRVKIQESLIDGVEIVQVGKLSIDIFRHGGHIWYNDAHRKHRLDGPASVSAAGDERWYIDGMFYLTQTAHQRDAGPILASQKRQEEKNK